jgi:D-sedoheptulose 7-phosphate isomerase
VIKKTKMKNQIIREIQESIEVKNKILNDNKIIFKIEKVANEIIKTIKNGGKIIFSGNGGSFADAQHLTAEFVSRLRKNRSPIPALALGTNSSNLSAIANDYGYENTFSRELEALGTSKDLFIPISTSGNSKNIINAIKFAKLNSIKTYGLTGMSGGEMIKICNAIQVPSNTTEKIQESHIMIGHILCYLTENKIFKNKID